MEKKKNKLSRVFTLLSLHRKVIKTKISFKECVQVINKRGRNTTRIYFILFIEMQ